MGWGVAERRGLYAITDGRQGRALIAAVEQLIAGGARMIQYRDKGAGQARRQQEASALVTLCRQSGVALIINDDIELASAVGADGVHLGEEDGAIAEARARLGSDAVIGISCYNNLQRAERFAGVADYLAFGAFYPSPTKPQTRRAGPALLRQARSLGRPLVAIGGIDPDRAAPLIAAGADLVAVISDLYRSGDGAIRARAAAYHNLFASHQPAVAPAAGVIDQPGATR